MRQNVLAYLVIILDEISFFERAVFVGGWPINFLKIRKIIYFQPRRSFGNNFGFAFLYFDSTLHGRFIIPNSDKYGGSHELILGPSVESHFHHNLWLYPDRRSIYIWNEVYWTLSYPQF